MKTKCEYYIGYRGLITEIIKLCFDINEKTKRSAFFNYSGHVGLFRVYISISKESGYNDRIFTKDIWSSSDDIKKDILELKQRLIDILNDTTNYDH